MLEGDNQYNAEQHGMQVGGGGTERDGWWRVLKQMHNSFATLTRPLPHPHLNTPPSCRQDARKGILFEGFPPVLQLQLKRFEYDFMKDVMVKVGALIRHACVM